MTQEFKLGVNRDFKIFCLKLATFYSHCGHSIEYLILNILFLVHKLAERWSKHLFMDHIDIKYHYVRFSCSINSLRDHWEQNIKAKRQRSVSFVIKVIYNIWQYHLSRISALPKRQRLAFVLYKDKLKWYFLNKTYFYE